MSAARARNLLRLLASRRVAVWLLVVFVLYAIVASAIPQGPADAAEVVAWDAAHPVIAPVIAASGLHAAFTHPVFIMLTGWLALATAACALERTSWALRQRSRSGRVSEAALDRLRTKRADVVELGTSLAPDDAVCRVAAGLRSLGLKTSIDGLTVTGRSGTLSLLGSPLFHWALAMLFVVISAGQLTRAEGLMGIVAGASKADVASSYGILKLGPLHGDLSGLTLTVTRLERDLVVRGVSFGPTPYVEVRDGNRLLKGQYVRANAPLRAGGLLVHMAGYDRAAVLSVTQAGASDSYEVFLDAEEGTGLTMPVELSIGSTGAAKPVVVTAAESSDPAIELSWESAGAPKTVMLREGESADVDGARVTAERLTMYARLSVVDDWSVWPMYALFALALLGVGMAVLAPARSALVLIEQRDGTLEAFVQSRHVRADPDWPNAVRRSVVSALEQGQESS